MTISLVEFEAVKARLQAVEKRLSQVDRSFGLTLYQLRRESIKNALDMQKILQHFAIQATTEDEVDAILESES